MFEIMNNFILDKFSNGLTKHAQEYWHTTEERGKTEEATNHTKDRRDVKDVHPLGMGCDGKDKGQ
tara:strand:+ start:343 stop:537 length:195 start_codon:yes stop_codon:yes gene_type:complete